MATLKDLLENPPATCMLCADACTAEHLECDLGTEFFEGYRERVLQEARILGTRKASDAVRGNASPHPGRMYYSSRFDSI